jgi:two-component system nitrogen regulation sensor histidine kinase NtrY
MAWYGRIHAHRRLMDETARRLKEETATVALNVVEPADAKSRASYPLLTEQMADQLATDLGTDFNLYRDDSLQVSTRPELYEAGILDRRLNGSVYASVILRGKRFYVETENIGLYQHAVGYRPLVARDGRVYGIVSVPTLYRQDQVDEEVSRQNAFVFGAYAIVLFVIVLIATTLANRIAAPIHSLTEATKRIARGDLDISVRMPQTDGEIGNLVRSFETMMQDLKENRKNLIRFERELAWKEMAKQVAHEIKNPLTPMKLSLQHLRQTYKDRVPNFDQVFEEVSKTIIEQIDTLGRIASEFSHFGRMPTPHLQPCDVNDVLKESVALFGPDPQTQFELSLADDLPVISADKEELRRAFINIIRNGIQAMNNAGRMLIASQEEGHRIVITFLDFGVGITDEAKERLFQPNFSTKTDGMGLGLAIVKKTLDDLKATIMIERAKGGGTLVTIGIPLTA